MITPLMALAMLVTGSPDGGQRTSELSDAPPVRKPMSALRLPVFLGGATAATAGFVAIGAGLIQSDSDFPVGLCIAEDPRLCKVPRPPETWHTRVVLGISMVAAAVPWIASLRDDPDPPWLEVMIGVAAGLAAGIVAAVFLDPGERLI